MHSERIDCIDNDMREGLRSSTLSSSRRGKDKAGCLAAQENGKELSGDCGQVTDNGLDLSGKENPGVDSDYLRSGQEWVNSDGGMNKSDRRPNQAGFGGGNGMEAKNKHKGNGQHSAECSGDNVDQRMMEKQECVEGQAGVAGDILESHPPLLRELYNKGCSDLGNIGKNSDNGDKWKEVKEVSKGEVDVVSYGKEGAGGSKENSGCKEDCSGQGEKMKDEDLDIVRDDNKALQRRLIVLSANDIENGGCSNHLVSPEDEGGKPNKLQGGMMNCDAEIVFLESEPNALIDCKEKFGGSESFESKLHNGDQRIHLKEEAEELKSQIVGKVLRSRIVASNGSGKGGGAGQTRGRKRKRGIDTSDSALIKLKKDESVQPVGVFKKKCKGRRGRPPKVKPEGSVAVPPRGVLMKKHKRRGRPPKVKMEGNVQEMLCNKKVSQAEKKIKFPMSSSPLKRKRPGVYSHGSKDVFAGQALNIETKKFKSGNDLINAVDDSSGLGLERKEQNLESESKHKEIMRMGKPRSRRAQQNSVRQRIVDMLLSAGWKIEYRPRQDGRDYSDAVYVSPQGKTHWSVTLAYKVLKRDVEDGHIGNEPGTSFCFNPIPEEELKILFRVVVNKRTGNKQKKGDHDQDDMSDEDASGVKSMKKKSKNKSSSRGRKKKNPLPGEEGNAVYHTKRNLSSGRDGKPNRRQCALLVRSSSQELNSASDGFVAHSGKHSVLSWMIDSGSVPLDGKVVYRRRSKEILGGRITRDGIHCDCCGKILSLTEFEAHSGSKLCQPYENMYLDNGSSLLQCLLDSCTKQESCHSGFHAVNVDNNDPNDDTCGICGDGGDLICCDGCPSTFHQGCLKTQIPDGDWFCIYCSCKYCGTFDGDTSADSHQSSSLLLTCRFCEEKYHHSCIIQGDVTYVQSKGPTFCGRNCKQMFEQLQRLVGVKCDLGDGFTWTLIQRSDVKLNPSISLPQEIENNSKLAVAQSIMNECFLPIIDPRSGINLIHNILYSCGSNFMRLNFSGFFTAILEKGDEVISAASIRIHGEKLAEMPFIATRHLYRRQGMCRRLLGAIESALTSLDVERLVIPAITELSNTWTSVFGFKPIDDRSKVSMQHINMLVFPGTDMLEKQLSEPQFSEDVINPISGLQSCQTGGKHPAREETTCKSEVDNGSNHSCDMKSSTVDSSEPSNERCCVHPTLALGDSEEKLKTRADSERGCMKNANEDSGQTTAEGNGGQIGVGAHGVGGQSNIEAKGECHTGASTPAIFSFKETTLEEESKSIEDTVCKLSSPLGFRKMKVGGDLTLEVGMVALGAEHNGVPAEETDAMHHENSFSEVVLDPKGEPNAETVLSSIAEFNSKSSCNLSSGSGEHRSPDGFLAYVGPEVGSK
ncbi:hypothetical protein Ancab_022311 [Ancistrocladus abbreviatus]